MKKRIFSLVIAATLIVNLCPVAFASNIDHNTLILQEINVPLEIIEIMPEEDINKIVTAYLNNPDSISISTSTLTVDVVSEMKSFSNMSDQELLSAGYSPSQISQGRQIIEYYINSSDSELLSTGLSLSEISHLRRALTAAEDAVLPYDLIAPTKLTFTQIAYNLSSVHPNYDVHIYFNWESPYFCDAFNDKIVIAWGGGLKQSEVYQHIRYHISSPIASDFGDYLCEADATYSEVTVDAMGIYTFPQSRTQILTGCAKSGSITYNISQPEFTGRNSKAIAYYAHQTFMLTGSIQFSGTSLSPSISIGSGYDTIFTQSDIRV